jgi:hypothetical protein
MKLSDIKQVEKSLIRQGKKLTDLMGWHVIGVWIDFYQKAQDC